jgi:pyruvate dehydrogenase complex dehydrogenase (E1) component
MPSQRDVYLAANILVKQHGEEAAIFAATSASRLTDKGDIAGRTLWMRVLEAVKELQGKPPMTDQPYH